MKMRYLLLVCSIQFLSVTILSASSTTPQFDFDQYLHSNVLSTSLDCPVFLKKCVGTKKWEDGSVYKGEMQYGIPHGKGKFTFADGSEYEGTLKKGVPHGFGKMVYADKSWYEGDWSEGTKEGKGAYTFDCGHEYLGEFKNDKINGKGSILYTSGESYEGEWKNGLADGMGTFYRLDGSRYIGMSKDGQREGQGQVIWESGDTLLGNWLNGQLVEEATHKFSDGSSMISFWEHGKILEGLVYISNEGEIFSEKAELLSAEIIKSNYNLLDSAEENMQIAWYGIAMEFKTNNDFPEAKKSLQFANNFNTSPTNTLFSELVKNQMEVLDSEAKKISVAKKDD